MATLNIGAFGQTWDTAIENLMNKVGGSAGLKQKAGDILGGAAEAQAMGLQEMASEVAQEAAATHAETLAAEAEARAQKYILYGGIGLGVIVLAVVLGRRKK
jgi:hypothetical protein